MGGGFFGGLIGYFIGSWIDSLSRSKVKVHTQRSTRNDFLNSLLILTAAVVKADGTFSKSEMNYIKSYLVRSLGPDEASEALFRLKEILGENYNVQSVCYQLSNAASYSERLLVLQFLFGLALADGYLHPAEMAEIEKIGAWMGVSRNDFESIRAMYTGGYSNAGGSSHTGSGSNSNSGGGSGYRSHTLADDYKILEVSPDASDEEVKKAYRTLAKKYHPDRVAHLGDDMRRQAEEKFARLSDAYDRIKKARGIK